MSPVVRDALAVRRDISRKYEDSCNRYTGRARTVLINVRRVSRRFGDGHYPRMLGITAYLPDPPLPLP